MFSAYRRLPVGVLVLSLCMGLGSSAATIVVSVSSLAGNEVAPDPKLATLPRRSIYANTKQKQALRPWPQP